MQDVNLDNHLHGALFYNSLNLKKMRSLNFQKLNLRKEDVLSKTQMKNILGGYDGGGDEKCTGKCGGGDNSAWSQACGKTMFSDCGCSRLDATWDNCKK